MNLKEPYSIILLMNGLIAAIASPFFSSIATVVKSQATKELSPLITTSIGGLLGAIILLLLLFVRKTKLDFKAIKNNSRDLLILIALRPLIGELILAIGLSLTTGIKAIFFTKTEPYFVLFWYWILKKEKIKKEYLLLLAIHIFGAIILSTGGKFDLGIPQIGDLFIILAMALFSLSYFYGKRLSNTIGAQSTNAISLGASGILLLPFTFIIQPVITSSFPTIGWIHLIIYVIFFNVIALTLWFSSLKGVPGWMVSALRSIGPILGAPIAYLFFKETLNLFQILGGIIVLTTSFLIAKEHLKSAPKAST